MAAFAIAVISLFGRFDAVTKHDRFSIAFGPWPGFDVLALADDDTFSDAQGRTIMERHGERVHLVRLSSQFDATRAVSRGDVDAAFTSVSDLALNPAASDDLVIVLITNVSDGADGLIARAGFDRLADLRGRTIGAKRGAIDELILAEALASASPPLKLEDVTVRDGANEVVAEWFLEGHVDAAALWEPTLSDLVERVDGKVLYRTSAEHTLVIDCMVVRRETLERERDRVEALIAAWFDVQALVRERPDEAFAAIGTTLGCDGADFAAAFAGLRPGDERLNERLLVRGGLSERLDALAAGLRDMGVEATPSCFQFDGSAVEAASSARRTIVAGAAR